MLFGFDSYAPTVHLLSSKINQLPSTQPIVRIHQFAANSSRPNIHRLVYFRAFAWRRMAAGIGWNEWIFRANQNPMQNDFGFQHIHVERWTVAQTEWRKISFCIINDADPCRNVTNENDYLIQRLRAVWSENYNQHPNLFPMVLIFIQLNAESRSRRSENKVFLETPTTNIQTRAGMFFSFLVGNAICFAAFEI